MSHSITSQPPAAPATRRRALTVTLWALQALLAIQFAGAVSLKLGGAQQMVDLFTQIGAGQWLRYLVGALELAGAVGLLLPRLSGLAALGLVGLLVGATATNLLVIDQGPWLPLGLLPVSALVTWARWPQTKTLAGTRRRWPARAGAGRHADATPHEIIPRSGTRRRRTRMNNPDQQATSGVRRAGRREWTGLAVLALACLLYAMDLTVLHLAVPSLSADLRPSSAQLLWIIDIYGFMVAGFLVTMGSLGDRIGRRRLLLLGAAAFGAVSVVVALSTSPEMLIGARALLGIAGAILAPSTLSLIFSMFQDPRQRTTAIAIWITSFSAGGAIGPVLGGVLLEHFWWGSVFLLAVPVMALLLVLGPRVLPEFRAEDAGRLDLASVAMLLLAVLAVVFGLKETAQSGISWLPVTSMLAGLVVAVVFVRRQLTLADPMIDLGLFRIGAFNASLATNLLGIFIATGYFLFVAQYLQLVLGLSPLRAGLWSLPSAGGFMVGSNLAPRVLRHLRPAYVIGAGLGVAAVGLGVLTQVGRFAGGSDDLAILAAASLVVSLGLAPVVTATTDLIVGSAPRERAGAASGISETGTELG